MKLGMRFVTRAGACAVLCTAARSPAAVAETAPPGFTLANYAYGLVEPVAMEFAADGRLFVAERAGTIRVIDPVGGVENLAAGGWPNEAPVAHVEVFWENENGLLGLTLDPQFADNGFVYVYATVTNREAQIIRYTAPPSGGAATDAIVIRDRLPTRGAFHSGGGLKFGPDGKLYFSIGDNLVEGYGQDLNSLAGKISRINADGTTPDDNPFKTPTGSPRATYALGLRNPFRFCFAPDGRLFACDVGSLGPVRAEEINLVRAGENYGWPLREGTKWRVDPAAGLTLTDPILSYYDEGASPVGIVFYTGENFPVEYQGDLFHIEYVQNRVYHVQLEGDGAASHALFVQASGGPVDLVQGPDGCLYYCELVSGRIQRVSHEGGVDVTSSTTPSSAPDASGSADSSPPPAAPVACGFGALAVAPLLAAGLICIRRKRR